MADQKQPVTFPQVQSFIGFGSILVTLALGWGNFSTKLDLITQKQDQMTQQQTSIQSKLDDHDHRLAAIETDVAVIKATLQTAKDQGVLSRNNTPAANTISLTSKTTPVNIPETKASGSSASLQPTPYSQQITYNNTVIAPTSQPEQKVSPTPVISSPATPTNTLRPTPTSQAILPAVLNGLVNGIL